MTDRRKFLETLGAALLAGTIAPPLLAADDGRRYRRRRSESDSGESAGGTGGSSASGRVIVVGGGMAGATVAKYLRMWGGGSVQVTLVEKEPLYTSCILSNLVLTDNIGMSSLYFDWNRIRSGYGVNFLAGTASAIDPDAKRLAISTAAGEVILPYDRLVLAPGIEFDYTGAWSSLATAEAQQAMPHAWKAGAQTEILHAQMRSMRSGDTFVMTIPPTPYRCPPGPYERACLVADWLKEFRPGSRLLVLDANLDIVAEKETFSRAFFGLHASVIDYRPNIQLSGIDPSTRTLYTTAGDVITGAVVNVIPPHKAGRLVTDSGIGLANVGGRWAGVDVLSYESTAQPGIHVIGDSSGSTQPKAGHIANQEAKVCADAIVRLLAGAAPDPAPVTNSACYSPITRQEASWLTAVFGYNAATRRMEPVPASSGEALRWTTDNFEEMFDWFRNLMADSFA